MPTFSKEIIGKFINLESLLFITPSVIFLSFEIREIFTFVFMELSGIFMRIGEPIFILIFLWFYPIGNSVSPFHSKENLVVNTINKEKIRYILLATNVEIRSLIKFD